jgi:hypothetical protein
VRLRRRKVVSLPAESYLRPDGAYFEIGSRLICPGCYRVLFRLTKRHRWGDILQHTAVEQVENVYPAEFRSTVTCPEHGDVHPRVLPPIT